MYFIGIDNGSSGSVGVVDDTGKLATYIKTPVIKTLNYTKKVQWVNRVDVEALKRFLVPYKNECKCMMERPMINPTMFRATVSASRAYEATLIVLDELKISFEYIDSKEWQRAMLPEGIKGSPNLKKASLVVGRRLFPNLTFKDDADGILISEYTRRINGFGTRT